MTPTPDTAAPRGAAESVTLAECPIGLFRSADGELCLKTEYGSNEGRIDAYIVSSGEFFCGASPQTIASQRAQLVTPVDAPAAAVEAGAGETGGWFDIASAPKDETEILVTNAHILSWYQVVSWDDERPGGAWTDVEGQFAYHPEMPTHWMPLPKPPGVTPTDAAPPARVTDAEVEAATKAFWDAPGRTEDWIRAALEAFVVARGAGHD